MLSDFAVVRLAYDDAAFAHLVMSALAPAFAVRAHEMGDGVTRADATDAPRPPWVLPGAVFWWHLSDPYVLPTPIPWRGCLGLWTVPPEVVAQMKGIER